MGFLYTLNIIFIGFILIFERKKPVSALAWIMTIVFLPGFGFAAYILFGKNLSFKKRNIFQVKKELDEEYNRILSHQLQSIEQQETPFHNSNIKQYKDMIRMHLKHSQSVFTQDNDVQIFIDAKEKYESLIRDIQNAKKTVNLLYYIIRDDTISRRIVNTLTEKAKEGIQVRILYDEIGSFFTPFDMFKELIDAGGKVCKFFPSVFKINLRANYRNHRKIAVIDGKIGYIGGMNIGDEYMGHQKKISPWRDTHLRIYGSSVQQLQIRFLMDWHYTTHEDITELGGDELDKFFANAHKLGKVGIQIVSSGPDTGGEQIKLGYIKMIQSAKKSLCFQSPYFIPDESFLEALKIAAMSGVEIKLMIPGTPDKKFVYRATTSYIRDLLDWGIKVYLYDGFLHSKMVIMDDIVTSIGTANIDIRSFLLDFEVNAFLYDRTFTQRCIEIFEKDIQNSIEVTKEMYSSRGLLIQMQEIICRLLSPLL